MQVGISILEVADPFLAGRLAALERDIDQLGDVGPGGDVTEPSAAQDRGFERELRRQPDAHLRLSRYLPGLVVENGVAAVDEALDAVGAGAQREHALTQRDVDLAGGIGAERRGVYEALVFLTGYQAELCL